MRKFFMSLVLLLSVITVWPNKGSPTVDNIDQRSTVLNNLFLPVPGPAFDREWLTSAELSVQIVEQNLTFDKTNDLVMSRNALFIYLAGVQSWQYNEAIEANTIDKQQALPVYLWTMRFTNANTESMGLKHKVT